MSDETLRLSDMIVAVIHNPQWDHSLLWEMVRKIRRSLQKDREHRAETAGAVVEALIPLDISLVK